MSTDKNNKTEELKLEEQVARAIFLADHPGAEWSPGRARSIWFTRAAAAIEAMIAAAPQPQPSRDREELRQQVAKMMQPWAWGSNTAVAETARNEALAKADAILSLTGTGGGSPLTAEQVFTAFREHVAPTLAPWGDQEPETRARYEAAARALRDSLACPTTKS